jgi:hypothetical protein
MTEKFDRLQRIRENRTMPRQIRRAFWKWLSRHGDKMTWAEYTEIESLPYEEIENNDML